MAYRLPGGKDTSNDFSNALGAAVQGYTQNKKMEAARAILNDPKSTPIQQALALAEMGQEKLGSEVYKGSVKEAEIAAKGANKAGIQERLQQNLGIGQNQGQQDESRDRSWVPDMSGRTPPIRDAGNATSAQPGAEGTGSPTQPGFSPNGPAQAARNATALDQQMPSPNMAGSAQGTLQSQGSQQVDAERQALAYEQAAMESADDGDHPNAVQYANKAKQIRADIRAEKIAETKKEIKDKEIALEIHKSEKKAYDDLAAEGEQAKKTSRARQTMIDQLATGKLNPKNARNLFANMFKGSPLLEGLFTTPEREVFKSAGVTQFEGMKDIFGVRLSDADLAIASTKVMDPSKPVEANLAIAKYWDFADKMKIEEANIAREVKKENGGFLPINWRELVHDKMSERFGDEAEQVVKEAANEGGSKPLKIIDGKIAIVAPDGRRKLVPQEDLNKYLLAGGIPE